MYTVPTVALRPHKTLANIIRANGPLIALTFLFVLITQNNFQQSLGAKWVPLYQQNNIVSTYVRVHVSVGAYGCMEARTMAHLCTWKYVPGDVSGQ